MNEHDKKWITDALNLLGLPMPILNNLNESEIEILWNVLSRFFGDITTANEYNKLKEE